MPTYTAHRLSSDNTLFPDRLEIDTVKLTYYKGNVLGYQSSIIVRNHITSVSVGSGLFFVDVIIETLGGMLVVASGFKKKDARAIIGLLT